MFTVSDHLAKIVSVTNVSEKHGKERQPAISIGLYLVGSSTLLDQFDTNLRPMLFRKPLPTPGELPMEHEGLTELRFPFMRNLAWDRKYEGYILRFHIGASSSEDVLLAECSLKDIRFVAQEGGSVGISFKVKAHPKDEADHGKVATRLQQEIMIDLTPPDKPIGLFDGDDEPVDDERDPFENSDLAQDETRID
ncbi:hypothetical protein [Paraburkholderia caballeronis]|uniref:hypothetical protein n=1 Tax=Paraburkholderia caballeronis TaxID=416943 RepID=UPI0010653FC1|nr:hypothetical protein [Paraburkholderia caballeronis]TDV06025.1 hypothetical protein C7408_1246 [Paraburkholderia caballeronis]TDV09565.1 hypothetical protein C7406_1266 [Paraburkholderia caballeronis]TDV21630.1 hypothetical protein C7404_1216 [Paraburkholderia caballeronis]